MVLSIVARMKSESDYDQLASSWDKVALPAGSAPRFFEGFLVVVPTLIVNAGAVTAPNLA